MRKNKRKTELTVTGDMGAAEHSSGKKKKRKKKIVLILVVAAVVLFVAARVALGALIPEAAAVVTTTQAVRGDLQESISTSGTVLSEEVKVVFAPVSGTLAEVNVEPGDAVETGEMLVTYDMEQMNRTLRTASLQLESSNALYGGRLADSSDSQAKLSEANVNLEVLNQQIADYEAYLKELQEKLSKSQRDTARALSDESFSLSQKLAGGELSASETVEANKRLAQISYLQQIADSSDYVVNMSKEIADVQEHLNNCREYKQEMLNQKAASENTVMDSYDKTQLNADRELANLSYQQVETDYYIAKAGVTAQFSGIVTECNAVPGAGVVQGGHLLTLESSEKLKVSFDASQYDIEKLGLGQQADVVISGSTYHGEVSKINRMAQRNASNTPMVGVELHLLDGDDRIILGMDAKLTIYTKKTENALLIPVEVINADRSGDFLYCVENGVVVRKPIVCGISTDLYTEVLEGITEEDVIVLSSFGDLEEGMPVTVMPDGFGSATTEDGGLRVEFTRQ